jgi:hypothetical protein
MPSLQEERDLFAAPKALAQPAGRPSLKVRRQSATVGAIILKSANHKGFADHMRNLRRTPDCASRARKALHGSPHRGPAQPLPLLMEATLTCRDVEMHGESPRSTRFTARSVSRQIGRFWSEANIQHEPTKRSASPSETGITTSWWGSPRCSRAMRIGLAELLIARWKSIG